MLNYTVVISLYMIVILILEYLYFLFYSREFPLISKKVFKLRLRVMFISLAFLYVANPKDSLVIVCIKVGIGLVFVLPYYFLNLKNKVTYYFYSTDSVNIYDLLDNVGEVINVYNFYTISQLDKESNIIKIELLNLEKNLQKQIVRELRIKTKGNLKNIETNYWIKFFGSCFLIIAFFSAVYVLLIIRS